MTMENSFTENKRQGWVLLYRSIQNHWIWNNDKYLKWWLTILLQVNHSEAKFLLGNELITIKKGQSCNSLRTWATLFKCTPKTVSSFFKLLQKEKMISVKTIGKSKQSTTLVTIDKYDEYQTVSKREVNAKETQSKHKLPTNKEVKEFKELKELKNIDRLSTNREILFKKLPGNKARIDIRPLIQTFQEPNIKKYIIAGVKNYTKKGGKEGYTLSFDESSSLIEMYFIKGFKQEWQPSSTLGQILTHCINWIGFNFNIDESDSQNNYHLKDNKQFWEAYNNLA